MQPSDTSTSSIEGENDNGRLSLKDFPFAYIPSTVYGDDPEAAVRLVFYYTIIHELV